MTEPSEGISQRTKEIVYIVKELGIITTVLGAIIWFHFHEFNVFKHDIEWKMERVIRNTRALMQNAGIPIIFDSDTPMGKDK